MDFLQIATGITKCDDYNELRQYTWTYDDEFSFLFLNLNKILENSTPGKVVCIWHIERVQIDAIKFERTQIHFLQTFLLPSSSSFLKVPNVLVYNVQSEAGDILF